MFTIQPHTIVVTCIAVLIGSACGTTRIVSPQAANGYAEFHSDSGYFPSTENPGAQWKLLAAGIRDIEWARADAAYVQSLRLVGAEMASSQHQFADVYASIGILADHIRGLQANGQAMGLPTQDAQLVQTLTECATGTWSDVCAQLAQEFERSEAAR
ncbi:MAG: hypothetical protein Q7S96_04905 [bacterium]|nr:hypothetical protein [bacterium]